MTLFRSILSSNTFCAVSALVIAESFSVIVASNLAIVDAVSSNFLVILATSVPSLNCDVMNSPANVSKILRPNSFSLAAWMSSLRTANSERRAVSIVFSTNSAERLINESLVLVRISLPSATMRTLVSTKSRLSSWNSASSRESCLTTKSLVLSKCSLTLARSSRNSLTSDAN